MTTPMHLPPLLYPQTPTIARAIYKTYPQDFIVEEQLTIDFSEQGEHLWLQLQKTGLNTAYVARLLAQWAQIPVKDVGYSGLKDRHAVTTQWFSLRLPHKNLPTADFQDFMTNALGDGENIRILAQHWHGKKLQRGTHTGNRFGITLREVQCADRDALSQQLAQITRDGVPNYFGSQRFGHNGQNLAHALTLFANAPAGDQPRTQGKRKNTVSNTTGLYLSAARSALFNAMVAKRVQDGTWHTPLDGEVMNLAGTNSVFAAPTIDDDLRARLAAGDIHLTAALWGDGLPMSSAQVQALELAVIGSNECYQALAKGLAAFGIHQERRALYVIPRKLTAIWQDATTLTLNFDLPTGSFATAVLGALVQTLGLATPADDGFD